MAAWNFPSFWADNELPGKHSIHGIKASRLFMQCSRCQSYGQGLYVSLLKIR